MNFFACAEDTCCITSLSHMSIYFNLSKISYSHTCSHGSNTLYCFNFDITVSVTMLKS